MGNAAHINGEPPWGARIFLILIFVGFAVLAWRNRRYWTETLKRFFTAETSPYNLAIFRIIAFAAIIEAFDLGYVTLMSGMPESLIFPPRFGWRHVIPHLPINPETTHLLGVALIVFCWLSLFGLFTRMSTAIAFCLAFYLIGTQMIYGKVNHWHHLVWFAGIAAMSPSGNALSIDAIFKSWRRADAGHVEPLPAARVYALPIRFAWVLMGIAYFWPGFWKFWDGGFAWAFSDNLKYTMYGSWFTRDSLPAFRIDYFDPLIQIGAAWTIVWEMTFVLLILWPFGRFLAAGQGVMFHGMTRMFLGIGFTGLQLMYLSFLDWPKWLHAASGVCFRRPCYVLYDGGCRVCRRTVATFNTFDLLGQVTWMPLQDSRGRERAGLPELDDADLVKDMHAVIGTKVYKGFDAYRALAPRYVVFWLALPLLYLPPIPQLGRIVYARVAHRRTCPIDGQPNRNKAVALTPPRPSLILFAWVFFLTAGNLGTGALFETQAWPISCYPTFNKLQTDPQIESIELAIVNDRGEETDYNWGPIRDAMWVPVTLIHRIRITPDEEYRQERWDDLLTFWRDNFDTEFEGKLLRLYSITHSTLPKDRGAGPLSRELVAEIPLEAGS